MFSRCNFLSHLVTSIVEIQTSVFVCRAARTEGANYFSPIIIPLVELSSIRVGLSPSSDGTAKQATRQGWISSPSHGPASGTEGVAEGHTEIYNYASGLHCSRPFISIMRRLRGCVDIGRSSAVTTRRGNLRVIILLTKLV